MTRLILLVLCTACVTTSTHEKALADLNKQHQDEIKAVVLDSMMPFMDGGATLHALREIAPAVKIIGVSGLHVDDKISVGPGGVQAFLTKPYTTQELLLKLNSVLRNE